MTNEVRLLDTIVSLNEDKEIIDWRVELDPSQPFLDFGVRQTPVKYVEAELKWYYSESLSVEFIEKYAKIWSTIKSSEGLVNSNYGWCIFSKANGSQYSNVLEKLIHNPQTKRACMIYTRPSMHEDSCYKGMKDFMCTNYVQTFIRDNRLIYIVHQRSCDFIYGFFNDFAWHCHVYMKLLNDLRLQGYSSLEVSDISYHCDTLHVYPRHYALLKDMTSIVKYLKHHQYYHGGTR